ncbi:MAG: aspartate/glutamate racemase family protein [Bryobacteraceae bacterium]|nr:aspartate/glutamate racemase family protein [Bryobacteraceae bacterium]
MRKIALVHTSPAAIPPLADYFKNNAPDLLVTNLLDDALLRCFSAGDEAQAAERLTRELSIVRDFEQVELAMITCSAVTASLLQTLRQRFPFPILKIDDLLAEKAFTYGRRFALLVTFAPTLATSQALLERTGARLGIAPELDMQYVPGAYDALLAGDAATHDGLLLAAIQDAAARHVDAVILTQVSMSRILPQIPADIPKPVLSSLPIGLEAVRKQLA